MNRRNFLGGLLTAAAGFTILPPATTYGRVWRASRERRLILSPQMLQCRVTMKVEPPPFGTVVTFSGFATEAFNGDWVSLGDGLFERYGRGGSDDLIYIA